MSIFRKALGVLVELNEAEPTRVVSPQIHERPVQFAPTVVAPAQMEKFEQHFDKLFEASNLPGPDYFEWSKCLDELETDIPDETSRMRVAFKTLKVQGLSKETLLSTAAQYKVIVETDRATMRAEVQAKQDREIAPLEIRVMEANNEVHATEEKIRELQNSLAAKRKAAEDANNAVRDAREKLGINIKAYEAACGAMISHIEQDITKITNTL